mmetsp:Transcript_11671/g.21103  ORF Transcript_11671/g.21103 Transcript_11671/m.21103 type:complete len:218 (+) Transcript_11671:123-776(+)
MRISSSTYSVFMEQVGGPLFQGRSFQTGLTGYHRSMNMPSSRGSRSRPGAVMTCVRCSSMHKVPFSASVSLSASVTTRPPKVGRSLNQPRIGITVKPKMVVSKEDSRVPFSKSSFWEMRPTVLKPQESTCSAWSLKKSSAFFAGSVAPSQRPRVGMPGELFSASSMARKNGEDRKSSTSEKTSSHSPDSCAWLGTLPAACAFVTRLSTSLAISSRFS